MEPVTPTPVDQLPVTEKSLMESLVADKEALKVAVRQMDEEMTSYKNLGTPESIEEAFAASEALVTSLGGKTAQEITEALARLALYEVLGAPDRVDKALDLASECVIAYKEIGSPEEITEALNGSLQILSTYRELGTTTEIEEAINYLDNLTMTESVDELATKYNVSESLVQKMFEKTNDFSSVEELLEASFGNRETAPDKNKTGKKGEGEHARQVNESSFMKISRALIGRSK